MIQWPDLTAYGVGFEIWEGRQARDSEQRVHYLVALGQVGAHLAALKALGGQLASYPRDSSTQVVYYPMLEPTLSPGFLEQIRIAFPRMDSRPVEPAAVTRGRADLSAEAVAVAISRLREAQAAAEQARTPDNMFAPPVGLKSAVAARSSAPLPVTPPQIFKHRDPPKSEAHSPAEQGEPTLQRAGINFFTPILRTAFSIVAQPTSSPPWVGYEQPPILPPQVRFLLSALLAGTPGLSILAGTPTETELLENSRFESVLFGQRDSVGGARAVIAPAARLEAMHQTDSLMTRRSDYAVALRELALMPPQSQVVLVLGPPEGPNFTYGAHDFDIFGYIAARYRVADAFVIALGAADDFARGPPGDRAHQVWLINGVREPSPEFRTDASAKLCEPISVLRSFAQFADRIRTIAEKWNDAEATEPSADRPSEDALSHSAAVQNVDVQGDWVGDRPRDGDRVLAGDDTRTLDGAHPQRSGVAADLGTAIRPAPGDGDPRVGGALVDAVSEFRGGWREPFPAAHDFQRPGVLGRDEHRSAVTLPPDPRVPGGEAGGGPEQNGGDRAGSRSSVVRRGNRHERVPDDGPGREAGDVAVEAFGAGLEGGDGAYEVPLPLDDANTLNNDVAGGDEFFDAPAINPAIEGAEAETLTAAGDAAAVSEEGEGNGVDPADAESRTNVLQLNPLRRSLAPVNALQSIYTPVSDVRAQGTMVPMNLSVPIRRALEAIQHERGPLTEFVAQTLDLSRERLSAFFFAEQIDALAMQLHAWLNGDGAIVGDMTGVGKGRVLAALVAYSARCGRVPIFVTDKANLFADFVRDLTAIEAIHLINPLILNGGVSVENEAGEVFLHSTKRADIDRILESGQLGDYNAIFMTYSQLQQIDAPRARRLTAIAGAHDLILDESDKASGESNTADNLLAILESAAGVTYSSATWAKEAKNMVIYFRTRLGDLVRSGDFEPIMRRGGEPLQEILSSMLAGAGQYIRREHDYQRAQVHTHVAVDRRTEHRRIANQVAEIWALMGSLTGSIFQYLETRNRELVPFKLRLEEDLRNDRINKRQWEIARRMGFSGVHIGSRLGMMVDQLLLVLSADVAAELAVEALGRGEKPIIAMSSTLGQPLQELRRADLGPAVGAQGRGRRREADAIDAPVAVCRATFRDLLHRYLDSLLKVTRRDEPGNAHEEGYLETLRQAGKADLATHAEGVIATIRRRIGELPDLPVSPIDWMRHRIEEAGYRVGELTGRTMGVDYTDERRPVYRSLPTPNSRNKNRLITAFNNGAALGEAGLDAIIMNRTVSAGISLHSDATFRDTRPRRMIIVQADPDAAVYMQTIGRIFRANMIGDPLYTIALIDLPAIIRPAAILNRKLASLSANTTSNRTSAQRREAPDMFNWLGDKVAFEVLVNDPQMARHLLIDIGREERLLKTSRNSRLMYRLTGRLPMLKTTVQEEVYVRLEDSFRTQLQQMEQAGETPFKTREFDFRARTVTEEVLEEGLDPNNPFDAPLLLREIEYDARLERISHEEAMRALTESTLRAQRIEGGARYPFHDYGPEIRRAIDTREQIELQASLQFESVEQAMASEAPSVFKRYALQRQFLDSIENSLCYGAPVNLPIPIGIHEFVTIPAWFLGASVLRNDRMDCFGEIDLKFLSLEENFYGTTKTALSTLMAYWSQAKAPLVVEDRPPLQTAAPLFENRVAGAVTQRRWVLCGNLLRGVEMAREKKAGTTAVYTNEDGERIRAVMMPLQFPRHELIARRLMLASDEMALDALNQFQDTIQARARAAQILISPAPRNEGWRIEVAGDGKYIERRAIRELELAWQHTLRKVKDSRQRQSVHHINGVHFEIVAAFVRAVRAETRVRWSVDATDLRKEWMQQWIHEHRPQLSMAMGAQP
jgi:hypothetical protein